MVFWESQNPNQGKNKKISPPPPQKMNKKKNVKLENKYKKKQYKFNYPHLPSW